jgi:hypothetical protein
MIRFKVNSKDGGKLLIGLGLSAQNIEKLKAGDPILFGLDELGLENTEVVILYGKTEEEMRDKIDEKGLQGYLQDEMGL